MISKRTLEKWRKEALIIVDNTDPKTATSGYAIMALRFAKQTIKLTQLLLDQHLLVK